jgi:hypothetical protein
MAILAWLEPHSTPHVAIIGWHPNQTMSREVPYGSIQTPKFFCVIGKPLAPFQWHISYNWIFSVVQFVG